MPVVMLKKERLKNKVTRPWTIKIEGTEGCNLMCKFCGIHGIRERAGNYRFMEIGMADLIAKQLAEFCPTARFEWEGHGDLLINPHYLSILKRFRKYLPDAQIQVTTNGLAIKDRFEKSVKDLLMVVDFIIFDTYKPVRRWLRPACEDLKKKNVSVYDYFIDKKSPYANYHRKFTNSIIMMDDLLLHDGEKKTRSMHNAAGNNQMIGPTREPLRKICTIPFREIFICHDGFIPLCCLDFGREFKAGHVNKKHIGDIWLGPRMEAARKILSTRLRGFSPCSRCNRRAGERVGFLPKYPPPTAIDIAHIIGAHAGADRLNGMNPYLHPEVEAIVLNP